MKHLALFLAFVGGIMLLYLIPKLLSAELGNDSAAENETRLERLEQALRDQGAEGKALVGILEGLALRIDGLESRLNRQPIAVSRPAEVPPAARAVDADSSQDSSHGKTMSAAHFKVLLPKVLRSTLDGTATEEEQQRFWLAARTTRLVDDTIRRLETRVEAHPQDAEARMDLADAYVAKLLILPANPERGIWGMKAEKQWKDVIRQDPNHWDAQYTLAYNYSMYPDFLNKTDDAIQGFERALSIQERVQPTTQHAKTYVQLARMHSKKGDTKKAREVLQLGQMRHPQDEQITAALQALEGK